MSAAGARVPGHPRSAPRCAASRGGATASSVRDASGGVDRFDQVVIATHADQALAMLAEPTADERRLLGAFRYAPNHAVLHSDAALMPRRRAAWSSWNYLAGAAAASARRR